MGKENWVIQGKIVKYGKTVGVFYVWYGLWIFVFSGGLKSIFEPKWDEITGEWR